MQGRRGEFMSRFLSPQIRDRVRDRGLQQALEQKQDEITIVCCDLRGFTGFAQAYDSNIVIGVLQQYYDAAGQAASRCGATIKDFAGDGVLFLIGAPEPRTDHAHVGLKLARELQINAAAVGSAVNLAARLCSIADDGEIRVAARTAELTQATGLRSLSPVALKGFGDAVEHYAW